MSEERCKWCGAGVHIKHPDWDTFDCGTALSHASQFRKQSSECKDRQIAALEKERDTLKQCSVEALKIIEKVGTTGIEHAHDKAEKWLKKYYPAYL